MADYGKKQGTGPGRLERLIAGLFGSGDTEKAVDYPRVEVEPPDSIKDDFNSFYGEYALCPIPTTRDEVAEREEILREDELALGQLIEGVEDHRICVVVDVEPASINPGDPHPVRILRIEETGDYELVAFDPLLFDSLVDERFHPITLPIGGWFSESRLERAEVLLIGAILDYGEPSTAELARQRKVEEVERRVREQLRRKFRGTVGRVEKESSERKKAMEEAEKESRRIEEDSRKAMKLEETESRRRRSAETLERKRELDSLMEAVAADTQGVLEHQAQLEDNIENKSREIIEALRGRMLTELPAHIRETRPGIRGSTRLELEDDTGVEMRLLETEVENLKREAAAANRELEAFSVRAGEMLVESSVNRRISAGLKGEVDGFLEAHGYGSQEKTEGKKKPRRKRKAGGKTKGK